MFKISFLPNYGVKYHDYIIKWCSDIACNRSVSLDIAVILALNATTGQTERLTYLIFDAKCPLYSQSAKILTLICK